MFLGKGGLQEDCIHLLGLLAVWEGHEDERKGTGLSKRDVPIGRNADKGWGRIFMNHQFLPAGTYRDLSRRPRVKIDRLDLGYVNAQVAVDSGAANAEKEAQIPGRPTRAYAGSDVRTFNKMLVHH